MIGGLFSAQGRRTGAGAATPSGVLPRAESLAAPLPPLLVAAERVAATVLQGVHGRRRIGQGETFWQFRRYEPGDPAHQIDWRQSAKSQRVFIRQTEWEAAQSVWLWRDLSLSMAWRSDTDFVTKRERAELLLLAVGSLLARGGEHFALLGGRDRNGGLATGRVGLRCLLDALEQSAATLAEEVSSTLPKEPLPRFSRLVLFSDFLIPLDEVAATVRAYTRCGVRGHLVQILDPAEETLPFSGRVRFEGCEGDGEILFGRVESVRDRYREAMAGHRRGLAALASQFGWTFIAHRTDQPPEPALLGLFVVLSGAAG